MSGFKTPIKLELLPDGTFVTAEPFTYGLGEDETTVNIVVPAGASTDLASIPRVFHWAIDPLGPSARAAILHDYLYRRQPVSRAVADATFLEALGVSGVSRWQRWVIYLAVRSFGWVAWRRNKKAKAG